MTDSRASSLERARSLALAQRYDEAISAMRAEIAANPRDADALVMLGNTLIMSHNSDHGSESATDGAECLREARRCFELAIEANPECVPAFIDLADWHIDNDESENASPFLASAERLLAQGRAWESLEDELADVRSSRERARRGR